MKTEKNIFIAFILNFFFSIFEFIGGILTNSFAIMSDALHDFGDAISIGISLILEKKARKLADNKSSYGYTRYSVVGSLITTTILLLSSVVIIVKAITRVLNPATINYDGMIMFAVLGLVINAISMYLTRHKENLNQKAVNLHMLEDVLGWIVVLVGAIIIKFSNLTIIDPILSIIVSLFIIIFAIKNLKEIFSVLLDKTPQNIKLDVIKEKILGINGVIDAHHLHVWSVDGINLCSTMHVKISNNTSQSDLKRKVKHLLEDFNINHSVIEIELEDEFCTEVCCNLLDNFNKEFIHKH